MRRLLIVLAVLGSLLVASGTASAVKTVAPPGNSGVDQYLETVPGASGNHGPGSGSMRPGARGGGAIPTATQSALGHMGKDGQATAALAASGVPQRPAGAGGTASSPAGGGAGPALLKAVGGSGGGMGVLLPILLVASTLGAAAIVLNRRRQRT